MASWGPRAHPRAGFSPWWMESEGHQQHFFNVTRLVVLCQREHVFSLCTSFSSFFCLGAPFCSAVTTLGSSAVSGFLWVMAAAFWVLSYLSPCILAFPDMPADPPGHCLAAHRSPLLVSLWPVALFSSHPRCGQIIYANIGTSILCDSLLSRISL